MTAIVAITPHICAAELTAISPLPLIDIVSEVAAAIRTRGLKRIALLGTRFTVESRMFDRLGVDVIMPKAEEIDQIHNTYMDVLHDRSTPAQIDGLRQVARTLIARDGAEAVLLAGTDLSMVLSKEDDGFRPLTARPYTSRQLRKSCSLTSPRAPECPLSAISGHGRYSISSSARASSCGVKAREALRRPDWPATRRRHRSPSPGPKERPAALRTR